LNREEKITPAEREILFPLKRQEIPSLEGTKKSLVRIGVFPFLKGLVKKNTGILLKFFTV
jgi:hypothetical protein